MYGKSVTPMMLSTFLVALQLLIEPASACPAPPPEATTADIVAHFYRHIQAVGQPVPECDQAIGDLAAGVCNDGGMDLFSRADAHAGLRQLAIAQQDQDAAELHCCLELAIRRKVSDDSSTPSARRDVNRKYLQRIEQTSPCKRSPICPADVLAPGFALNCVNVSAIMTPLTPPALPIELPAPAAPDQLVPEPVAISTPIPASATVPGTEPVKPIAPPQSRPPPPKVNLEMRRGGIAALTLGLLSLGITTSALIIGSVANEKIRTTPDDIRMRWDEAGQVMNPLAVSAAVISACTIVGISLIVCSRPEGCRRGRPVSPVEVGLGPTSLAVRGRF